jgi:hypothetical protein
MLEDVCLEQLAPLFIHQHATPFSMMVLFVVLLGVCSIPYLYFGGAILLQLMAFSLFIQVACLTVPIWFMCYFVLRYLDKLLGCRMLGGWLRSQTSAGYRQHYQEAKLAKAAAKKKLLQQVKVERSDILVHQVQVLLQAYKQLYYGVQLSESENLSLLEIHKQLLDIMHQLKSLTEGLNIDIGPLLLEWREANQCYQQALLDYQRTMHSPWFSLKKYKTKKTPVRKIRKQLWLIIFGLMWLILWLWYISKFNP